MSDNRNLAEISSTLVELSESVNRRIEAIREDNVSIIRPWVDSEESPDGDPENKSAKSWAEEAEVFASVFDPVSGSIVGGTTGQVLRKNSNDNLDFSWGTAVGAGDMLESVYDPNGISEDAFDRKNHHGKLDVGDVEGLRDRLDTMAVIPLGFTTIWHQGRETIPSGFVPRDGQILSRETYPNFWNWIQTTGRVISETEWQSNPAKRAGYYSDGNGASTFRMQDANGLQIGSFKAVYERGSYGHGFSEGMTHGDATRRIWGSVWGRSLFDQSGASANGAFTVGTQGNMSTSRSYDVGNWQQGINIDTSLIVPTTDTVNGENRTIALVGVSIMRIASVSSTVIDDVFVETTLNASNTWNGSQTFVQGFSIGENSKLSTATSMGVPSSKGSQSFTAIEKEQLLRNIGGSSAITEGGRYRIVNTASEVKTPEGGSWIYYIIRRNASNGGIYSTLTGKAAGGTVVASVMAGYDHAGFMLKEDL